MEEHSDVLKKMGSRLTKLEEAKLKKAAHVEIPDDEEVEGWDERDKVDYERNKQFKKLIAEIVAMKEKMEKIQLTFRKAQMMDDCLLNMGRISSKTPIALPPKFKIFYENFDGTGDPKHHVRRYLSIAKMKSLDEKQTLHAFLLSLTGGASRWYYSLDPSKTKVWNELVNTIAPPRSSKHVPTPIWVWKKHGRRLIKIENTHQEEVFQEGESPQVTTAAPINDETTERILR